MPRNGPTRTYIWAYNHTYPIAEVINATQTQVEGNVGSLESIAPLTDANSLQTLITSLRSSLPQAQINSTIMLSGVGVSKITNPAELSSSYEYDNLGRLTRIRNNNNDIIKEYAYNYGDGNTSGGSNGGNQAPYSTNNISDQVFTINQAMNYALPSNLFSDPEGQQLTYSISGLPAGLSYANNTISGTPTTAGLYQVTITATDPTGLSGSTSFFLTVSTCLIADPYIVSGTYSSNTPVTFNALSRIESDANQGVLVNQNASLILKAGQSVKLKSGFVIKPGAAFRAYTGPCN